ncbi:GD11784 [Drosophila simulans]|nr:GD11784 [Drosophila simulans]
MPTPPPQRDAKNGKQATFIAGRAAREVFTVLRERRISQDGNRGSYMMCAPHSLPVTSRLLLLVVTLLFCPVQAHLSKRSYSDQSVHGYMTERTCWWNEVCKEEFQSLFRCKCPQFSYCRSPGRYYNAYCSMTDTGYIWTQPNWDWGA